MSTVREGKPPYKRRTKAVHSDVTPELKERVGITAKLQGKSESQYLRDLLDEHAVEEIPSELRQD